MKINVDTDRQTLVFENGEGDLEELDLFSPAAFSRLSRVWLRMGWVLKYPYSFTWMGRPVIQLPEDLLRIQEVIYRVKPDVVIETGVAHGGSLVFYASLFRALGRGRVVGIDVAIRPANRAALERHELFPLITLIEGSSIDPEAVAAVRSLVSPSDRVLVVLDSDHSKAHVRTELETYAPLVSVGSYIVATDGIMEDLHDAPRGHPAWNHDNPKRAAEEFLVQHPEFDLEDPPPFLFNEGDIQEPLTYWPNAYLKRHS